MQAECAFYLVLNRFSYHASNMSCSVESKSAAGSEAAVEPVVACPKIPFHVWQGRTCRTLDLRPLDDTKDIAELLPKVIHAMGHNLHHLYFAGLSVLPQFIHTSIRTLSLIGCTFTLATLSHTYSLRELNVAHAKYRKGNGEVIPIHGRCFNLSYSPQLERLEVTGMQRVDLLKLPKTCTFLRCVTSSAETTSELQTLQQSYPDLKIDTTGEDVLEICKDLKEKLGQLKGRERDEHLRSLSHDDHRIARVAANGFVIDQDIDLIDLFNQQPDLTAIKIKTGPEVKHFIMLAKFSKLEELALIRNDIKDSHLMHILLDCKALKRLDLSDTRVSSFTLRAIESIPNITYLKIADCENISDEDIHDLQQARPDLCILADDMDDQTLEARSDLVLSS